jgi:hypothetical protein
MALSKKWAPIIERAIEIVNSYETDVTFRQLFYRLVSEGRIDKTKSDSTYLNKVVTELRRQGEFPDLVDDRRQVHRALSFESPKAAMMWLPNVYRRPRDEGQRYTIYMGSEANATRAQLENWFSDYGVGVLPLGGIISHGYIEKIRRDVIRQGREAVLIYAGDLDPTGDFISKDAEERAGCFDEVKRVAITDELVEKHGLIKQDVKRFKATDAKVIQGHAKVGEPKDTKYIEFAQNHDGEVFAVELEALDPKILRTLYEKEFFNHYDLSKLDPILEQEAEERERLRDVTVS